MVRIGDVVAAAYFKKDGRLANIKGTVLSCTQKDGKIIGGIISDDSYIIVETERGLLKTEVWMTNNSDFDLLVEIKDGKPIYKKIAAENVIDTLCEIYKDNSPIVCKSRRAKLMKF